MPGKPARSGTAVDPSLALLDLCIALPTWRLDRALWAQAWGRRPMPGSVPFAGHDEDSLTLAADAIAALNGGHPETLAASTLAMVTTTAPDAERSSAAVLAAAFGAPHDTLVIDLGGSLQASTAAVRTLAGHIAATGRPGILCCADTRAARPGTDLEMVLGQAGAAALLGAPQAAGALAVLIGTAAVNGDLPEAWRPAGSAYVSTADPAFAPRFTLGPAMRAVLETACADAGVSSAQLTALAAAATDMRALGDAASAAGCGDGCMAAARLSVERAGFSGMPAPWIALAAALSSAAEGDTIVQLGAGAGSATALVWRVAAGVTGWRERGCGGFTAGGRARDVPSYSRALRLRGELGSEQVSPYVSLPLVARELEQDLGLIGSECPGCGRVDFPARPVCPTCGSRKPGRRALARRGRLVTFTEDHVYPSPEPPTVMAVADMDGGGRLFAQLTGVASGEARPRLAVEAVLRRLHSAGGWAHYFWKLRPAREAAAEGSEEAER